MGKNFSTSFGLNYSKKGNREYTVFNSSNPNNPDSISQTISDNTWHMHYAGLSAKIHVNKLNIFVGGQVSYLWLANTRFYYNSIASYNGHEYYSDTQIGGAVYELGNFDTFNRIDLGLMLGYEHKINSKAKLTLTYYQGLRGVLNNDYFINYKNSQITIGFSYALTNEMDKEKE